MEALCTLKVMVQLPSAGIFASASVTLPAVWVSDRLAPPQVVTGAVVVEINRSPVTDIDAAKLLLHPGHNLMLVYYQGYQRYLVVTTP